MTVFTSHQTYRYSNGLGISATIRHRRKHEFTMPKSRKLFPSLLAFVTILFGQAASAQEFPEGIDGLLDYAPWEQDGAIGGSSRTDSEGGWASLSVDRMSSADMSMNSIEFYYSFGVYDDFIPTYESLFGRDLGRNVSIVVDGRVYPALSAIMNREEGEGGGIGILIRFYDPADETSPDVWQKSCPVVQAISQARQIEVRFPRGEGSIITGRGSSSALRDVCGQG